MDPISSEADILPYNARIELAIDDIKSQKKPNYKATAKKYNIGHLALSRRHQGKTTSYDDARSSGQRLLNNLQEALLIKHIEKLADRGILYSPQIIENLAVGIAKRPLRGRWVERFTERHANQLKSIYIRNIDHARKVADNSRHFEHYFNLV